MQTPLRLQAIKAALIFDVIARSAPWGDDLMIPEAADADSAAAKGEVVDPRYSGVAKSRACSMHFEGGSEIALLF